jgi:hypothetical protein
MKTFYQNKTKIILAKKINDTKNKKAQKIFVQNKK